MHLLIRTTTQDALGKTVAIMDMRIERNDSSGFREYGSGQRSMNHPLRQEFEAVQRDILRSWEEVDKSESNINARRGLFFLQQSLLVPIWLS